VPAVTQTFTSPFRPDVELKGPVCQGSLLAVEQQGVWRLLFSGPCDAKARRDLRVRRSRDGGDTWEVLVAIHAGAAAYSDLVQVTADDFACLFEADDYARIVWHPFSVALDQPDTRR
jgi:hypothetical protein